MPSSERDGGANARTRGFTLIEVLAAVLVLGVLYTVLAGVAIEGLRAEGASKRRIEASLLADQILADLEDQIAVGSVPPVGLEEREADVFDLTIAVRELDPAVLVPPEPPDSERELRREGSFSLFETGGTQPSRLREIEVRVDWLEGDRELTVQRISYAFDTTGLEDFFPEAGQPPGEAPGAEEDEDIPQGLRDLGLDADAIEALKGGKLPEGLR